MPSLELVFSLILFAALNYLSCSAEEGIFPGADEKTPSRALYFDWINSQYEGSTEEQTLTNLEFFKWLYDEYGMELDVYSLDVGNVDDGPFTAGVGRLIPNHCGTLDSEEFKRQFPNGFGPLCEKAKSFGCRLGIWLGPDGFGDTPQEEEARGSMLVKLCRDYNFMAFKLDAVAGGLRVEKQETLARALKECRKHCPDLMVLNHRVDLGQADPHATCFLWEGEETYIDVFSWNGQTAPHHRAGALSRPFPPGLTRLMEDHGVCISSCLDSWEDDLILQMFNRGLILAPEIYGNPWLLRDDEFPRLARICNLFRRYRGILVNGMVLPKEQYGPLAVSRGDDHTRFIALRNLTWNPVKYKVRLDESIGLARAGKVELRKFHPSESIFGQCDWGAEAEVSVGPFRTTLVMATTRPCNELGIQGSAYTVVRDIPGRPARIKLLGGPGTEPKIRLSAGGRKFSRAELDREPVSGLLKGHEVQVAFPGEALQKIWHRRLGTLEPCAVPVDAEALYESTCFAADSNALEVRSLLRSGPTGIPQVEKARKAFFEKPMFVNRGIWDKNLFDGDMKTFFIARLEGRALRIDFGELIRVDRLVIKIRDKQEHDLNPALHRFEKGAVAEVSSDLKTWIQVGTWSGKGTIALARIPPEKPMRFVRIHGAPRRIAEVEGFWDGTALDRSRWRASNLFFAYEKNPAVKAWSSSFKLEEIAKESYLAIALNGRHGNEGAYAAIRVEGEPVGAPDRAVSYPSNTWEYYNVEQDSHYTYYVPLSKEMVGKTIDAVVLGLKGGTKEIQPEAYITAHRIPFESRELVLYE